MRRGEKKINGIFKKYSHVGSASMVERSILELIDRLSAE